MSTLKDELSALAAEFRISGQDDAASKLEAVLTRITSPIVLETVGQDFKSCTEVVVEKLLNWEQRLTLRETAMLTREADWAYSEADRVLGEHKGDADHEAAYCAELARNKNTARSLVLSCAAGMSVEAEKQFETELNDAYRRGRHATICDSCGARTGGHDSVECMRCVETHAKDDS